LPRESTRIARRRRGNGGTKRGRKEQGNSLETGEVKVQGGELITSRASRNGFKAGEGPFSDNREERCAMSHPKRKERQQLKSLRLGEKM